MEQMNIFDLLGNEEKDKFKVFESTDWKWTFDDYPKEKNGEKRRCFSSKLVWSDIVCPTVTGSAGTLYRVEELSQISIEDVIHAQTFPEDYDFVSRTLNNVTYICGMSVPPVMTKRIMMKLIEQGVYDYKLKRGDVDV